MGNSAIAQPVSAQIANDIVDMLERRAKARGVTRSRYLALLLEDWRAKGYPAIDAIDSTARALVKQQMTAENVTHTLAAGEADAEPVEGGRSANAKSRRIHRKAAA